MDSKMGCRISWYAVLFTTPGAPDVGKYSSTELRVLQVRAIPAHWRGINRGFLAAAFAVEARSEPILDRCGNVSALRRKLRRTEQEVADQYRICDCLCLYD
jgi:hypothetical protein